MDKEYIEREALLSHLFSKQDEPLDVMKEIAEFPAADVVEVVHGRWNGEGDGTVDPLILPNCCPNCGARMEGGKGR